MAASAEFRWSGQAASLGCLSPVLILGHVSKSPKEPHNLPLPASCLLKSVTEREPGSK